MMKIIKRNPMAFENKLIKINKRNHLQMPARGTVVYNPHLNEQEIEELGEDSLDPNIHISAQVKIRGGCTCLNSECRKNYC